MHLSKTRQNVWEASVLTTGLMVRTLALFGPSSDPSRASSQLVLSLLRRLFSPTKANPFCTLDVLLTICVSIYNYLERTCSLFEKEEQPELGHLKQRVQIVLLLYFTQRPHYIKEI